MIYLTNIVKNRKIKLIKAYLFLCLINNNLKNFQDLFLILEIQQFYQISMKKIFLTFFIVILINVHCRRLFHNIDSLSANFKLQFCKNCSTKTCDQNLKNVNNLDTNNFTLEMIEFNKFGVKTVMSQFGNVTNNYRFPNKMLNNINMSYVAFIPQFPKRTTSLQGVVIYMHPTLFGKMQAPTELGNQIMALASLYCSQNYALVIPNYIGYGQSDQAHPFLLYPQENLQSAISSLNDISGDLAYLFKNQQFDLFSVGYSEGASYSLWLDKCLSDPSACQYNTQSLSPLYKFRSSIGLDGPYQLSKIIYPFLQSEVSQSVNNHYKINNQTKTNFAKPGLLGMVLNSYGYYENIEDPSKMYQKEFYELKCNATVDVPSRLQQHCKINKNYANIKEILSCDNLTSVQIEKCIASSAIQKKLGRVNYLSATTYLIGSQNSVLGLVEQEVFKKSSSPIINVPSKKIFLFSLQNDSVFSVRNSEQYFNTYSYTNRVKFLKFPNRNHTICNQFLDPDLGNVDHNEAQLLANIYALAFIVNETSMIT